MAEVTQRGGASTHYGILHQVLSGLAHTFRVTTGQKNVSVTVEPAGSGGDLVEEGAGLRRVYQYKARADRSTWSLKQLVDGVFPDLLRAVPDDGTPTEYIFVTEGSAGDLDELWRLKSELEGHAVSDDPLKNLGTVRRHFFPKPSAPITAKQFFQRVAKAAYKQSPKDGAAKAHQDLTIWRLLANFRIETESFAAKEKAVFVMLRDVADAREDIRNLARELYGHLLEISSFGNEQITTERLLQKAGIHAIPLGLLPTQPDTARRLEAALRNVAYDRSTVIRRPIEWARDYNVLADVGGSGQGKTTLLGQLAEEALKQGPVVFVPGGKTVEDAVQNAADQVWKGILRHDRPIGIEGLARRAGECGLTEGTQPWLTIVLDLTATADDVRELLSYSWAEWKIRLAFSATHDAARVLDNNMSRSSIAVVQLNDFTEREVREFLRLRGKDEFLPADVLDTLKRPVVASVYATLETSGGWRPENEYALYDRFWKWIDTAPGQAEFHTSTALVRFAGTLLDLQTDSAPAADLLPWMDAATIARLEKVGWLIRTSADDIRFRHERFLNWAIAKALVERLRRNKCSDAEFAEVISANYATPRVANEPYLGYVAMDAVWLTLSAGLHERLQPLLERLEGEDHQQFYETIATIGTPAIPLLVERLKRIQERHAWASYRATAAIREIARRTPLDPSTVRDMLFDESWSLQDTALLLLAERPDQSLLDRIWSLRRDRDYSDDELVDRVEYDQKVTDAIVSAARRDPGWLRTKLRAATDGADAALLLVAVRGNGTPDGQKIWSETKSHVLSVPGVAHLIAAARCIEHFQDAEETDRLIEWCTSGTDFVPAVALRALGFVATTRALELLDSDVLDRARWSLSQTIQPLMIQVPEKALTALRASIAADRLYQREIAFAFRGPTQLDAKTIAVLVAKLATAIGKDPAGELPYNHEVSRRAEHVIEALEGVASVEGLACLRELTSSPEGDMFAEYVIGRLKRSRTTPDFFIRSAHKVLLRIGGEPLSRFLEAQIADLPRWPRAAILSVAMSPTKGALARIHEILRGAYRDPTATRDETYVIRQSCIEVIAGAEGRAVAINAVQKSGGAVTERVLAAVDRLPPVNDLTLDTLLTQARSTRTPAALALIALAGRNDAVMPLVDMVQGTTDRDLLSVGLDVLRELIGEDAELAQVLRLPLGDETLSLLNQIGTAAALEEVEKRILGRPPADTRSYSASLAAYLVAKKKRVNLVPVVRETLRRSSRYDWDRENFLLALGYSADAEAEEILVRRAFGSDGAAPSSAAIEGLAVRDAEKAREAAVRLLRGTGKGRSEAVDILFELDPLTAVDTVIEHIPDERNVLVRNEIAKNIRQRGGMKALERVRLLIRSNNPARRAAGCELAGWLDDFESAHLKTLALGDLDPMVRSFATFGVQMQADRPRVRALLSDFSTAVGSHAWAIMQGLIGTGEPLLVIEHGDVLSIGPYLRDKPAPLAIYAEETAKERWKQYVDATDKNMRDDFYR
jgi:hypothetical protein